MGQDLPTRTEFLYFSTGEKALFYVLVAVALASTVAQFAARARLWRQGKPSADARGGWRYWVPKQPALARWLKNVWRNVIGQRKVQTSRAGGGAPMHLAIFYGFLALFLGTTLLAINTYSPIKFHDGDYYLIYEFTLDLMGTVFLLGVIVAFFRRLSMSRAYLGSATIDETRERQWAQGRRRPLSSSLADHGALGLLFALGITGFLSEAARMAANPKPFDGWSPVGHAIAAALPLLSPSQYKLFWWFHVAWVLVFFLAMPRLRLRHLVVALLASADPDQKPPGALAPVSIEEVERTGVVGVSTPGHLPRHTLMGLDACMECGRCTEVCPAWGVGKALNPKLVVQDFREAMERKTAILPLVSEEALWQCTTCNACVEACPVHLRPADLLIDLRRFAVAEGKLSGSGAGMLRQTASTSHAWGLPPESREDWMKGLDVPLCRDGEPFDVLLWVGCAAASDPGAAKTTRALAQLFKQAGVGFACLGREECCTGDAARRVGDEFLFQELAARNLAKFQKYGVRSVVTPCPHCFNTLKNEYGEFGPELTVRHHTQLLAQLVEQGRLKAAAPAAGEVTYHDPCYLARANNESDAPRAVFGHESNLNSEAVPVFSWLNDDPTLHRPLAEPENHGRKTLCCGAGGGRMWMDEPVDQRPSSRRLDQLLATGAKSIAIGCPFCRIMLDAGLKQRNEEGVRLLDVADALIEANPTP